MALQVSGTISMANLQTEYGGVNPIGMNEYYRKLDNSGYVLDNKNVVENPTYVYDGTSWAWASPSYLTIKLGGVTKYTTSSAGGSGVTSVTAGGWTYVRGSYIGEVSANYYYAYSRNQDVLLNQGVPTTGPIALNQFYEGTN